MRTSARGFLFLTALLLGGTPLARAQSTALPLFGHVFVVVEENTDYASVVGNPSMPYLNSLIANNGLATNYVADTHPSLDNYFMLTAGTFEAGNDPLWNCTIATGVVSDDNIVRELLAAGKTWKLYAESLPAPGYTGCGVGNYVKRHNPFAYLNDVADVPAQAANMVDFTGNFAVDLANGTLPHYSFIVPNLMNDAHSGTLAEADAWLATHIAPLIASSLFQRDGLLVIVFEEDGTANPGCTGAGNDCGGHVAAVIVSPFIKSAGFTSDTSYHHENVLRLTAEGLGLKTFPGGAATSENMAEFFNAPEVSLTPASVDFGNQRLDATGVSETVTLTNTGTAPLAILHIATGGDFRQSSDCPLAPDTLAAGAPCTISVTFAPTARGSRTGQLTINAETPASPYVLDLAATAASAVVSLSPSSLTFATRLLGTTSAGQDVTLSNTGDAPMNITSKTVSSRFAETDNCGSSVAAGTSCTISVTFTPTATGPITGSLAVSDDLGNTYSVSLTGAGMDFVLAVPSGSESATINAGQVATYGLTLTPTGFVGTVQLTCTGAPSRAACAVSPDSAALDGVSGRVIIASVATTAPGAAMPEVRRVAPPGPVSLRVGIWLLAAMLATLMMASAGVRSRKAQWRRWAALGALASCLSLAAACGGGGASPPARRPGTPSGTYHLTVTATYAGTVSRSTTLTLIVR